MPRAVIIAGPNGAGKTTLARELLPKELGLEQFLNADLIAAGLSPFASTGGDVEAGRILIEKLDAAVAAGEDFALETTLSGRWLARRIGEWRESGYLVELVYLQLSNPQIAIQRIRKRVAEGGHHVSDETVRRRFCRSGTLFDSTYKTLVDSWTLFDVDDVQPELLACEALSLREHQSIEGFAEVALRALRRGAEKANRPRVVMLEDLLAVTQALVDAGLHLGNPLNASAWKPVFEADPNLGLAVVRAELERRLRAKAEADKVPITPGGILEMLWNGKLLPPNQASAMARLLHLLNAAVHGAEAMPDTSAWAADQGLAIAASLVSATE